MSGKPEKKQAGFTLVEVMIVATLGLFVIAGILSFFIQFYQISFVNGSRNLINKDIRQFTAELTKEGRQSTYFKLFNSHVLADRNETSDQLSRDQAGDLLVFASIDYASGEITSITGYFRDPDINGLGPVRKFVVNAPLHPDGTLVSNLPSEAEMRLGKEVVELSKGLADGKLFFNYLNQSIMVNGQIYHGSDAKRVTETYNFTISPRG